MLLDNFIVNDSASNYAVLNYTYYFSLYFVQLFAVLGFFYVVCIAYYSQAVPTLSEVFEYRKRVSRVTHALKDMHAQQIELDKTLAKIFGNFASVIRNAPEFLSRLKIFHPISNESTLLKITSINPINKIAKTQKKEKSENNTRAIKPDNQAKKNSNSRVLFA